MNDYVADTHSLYWFLTASPRLGANAKSAFDEAQNGLAFIHISAIVLAELYYLNSKYSSPIDFAVEFQRLKAGSQYVLTPIDPDDIEVVVRSISTFPKLYPESFRQKGVRRAVVARPIKKSKSCLFSPIGKTLKSWNIRQLVCIPTSNNTSNQPSTTSVKPGYINPSA